MHVRLATLEEIRDRAAPLLRAHWDEIAKNKHLMVLDPDWDAYARLDESDILLVLAAIDGDELVGYSVSFVHPHLHYRGLTYAQNDVLFVAPSHRQSQAGLRLIAATEQHAKERGARMVMWHAKPGTALEHLLPRLGYSVQDVIFAREI